MNKNKFSDLITEQGFPNERAKKFIKEYFCKEAEMILSFANSETEVRIIGSVLKNIIGDIVSTKCIEMKNVKE